MTKSKRILVLVLVIIGIWALILSRRETSQPPNATSTAPVTETWQKVETREASFKYPQSLLTDYIGNVDWPPVLQVLNEPYSCTEAGLETDRAGETVRVETSGTEYCQSKVSDAAAGSMYTQYAYARKIGEKTVILTFSLRFSQCSNYPEEEMFRCQVERDSFDTDSIVHAIAETIKLK